jgi:type IV secretory pathway protease TraF
VALAMPLKQIAGMPGDIVSVTPQGSYINGRLIPNSAPLLPRHYPYGQYILGACPSNGHLMLEESGQV